MSAFTAPHGSDESKNTETVDKKFELEKESELRLHVSEKDRIRFKLISGKAEVFGAELRLCSESSDPNQIDDPQDWYEIENMNVAIFTWGGCVLKISGTTSSMGAIGMYKNMEETPMPHYLRLHADLEKMRKGAAADSTKRTRGPRVIVVGPADTGKSTLVRILANYAVRAGNQPTHVDIDCGQNSISIPGTIAATPVEHVILGTHKATGFKIGGAEIKAPLVFFLGHSSPGGNIDLYKKLITRLATGIKAREMSVDAARTSGAIINTCGWVEEKGLELVKFAIREFEADVIIVPDEKLASVLDQYSREMNSRENIKSVVVYVKKANGVVMRDKNVRAATRNRTIHEYFYGDPDRPLAPRAITLTFNNVSVFSSSPQERLDSSLRPIGHSDVSEESKKKLLHALVPTNDLSNSVLGVSFAKSAEDLENAPVAGFVHIQKVDKDSRVMVALAPNAYQMPGTKLISGSLKWVESAILRAQPL